MAQTLSHLVTEIRTCTLCEPDLPLGARPVLQASAKARILIAGQAPGRKVHASGKPFTDPSGERLRAWLGVTPEQFYDDSLFAILPMGFCYPGTGKSGDLPPRPECAALWRQRLLDKLPKLELTLVIGQYAMAWHLPGSKGTVTEQVQRWPEHWPHLLPLPHPSPRNNVWLRRNAWFEAELLPVLQARVKAMLAASVNS